MQSESFSYNPLLRVLKKDLLKTYDLVEGGKFKKILDCYRSPGVHAIITLRFGQWLEGKNILGKIFLLPIYIFLSHRIKTRWGIEIPRATEIGEGSLYWSFWRYYNFWFREDR